ncbi:uncharacterized protein IL334_006516 [Kwoniella shivajii]|uniref:DH domain-containing protein n=1 Tax=Kwoniella shivajii TaxID=564305 RepID=A0ABZ1D895_9TREE|nr:hypothetical protein IL334_006516 [Kwoniella shivajii]
MRIIKRRSTSDLSQEARSSTSLLVTSGIPVPPVPGPSYSRTDETIPAKGQKLKKKRDSAEMKYPPTSFGQSGGGWSFGKMRSLKGKSRMNQSAEVSDFEDDAASVNQDHLVDGIASRDNTMSNVSPPFTPQVRVSTVPPTTHSERIPDPASAFTPIAPQGFPQTDISRIPLSSSSSHVPYAQPHRHVVDFTPEALQTSSVLVPEIPQGGEFLVPPSSRPQLISAPSATSATQSFESSDSSYPLVTHDHDVGPHPHPHPRPVLPPTSPRKLTKRRPVSAIYDQVELLERPSFSPDQRSNYSRPLPLHDLSTQTTNVLPTSHLLLASSLSSLPLPEGAAPPQNPADWSLNRNPSSSTNASSGMTPSTDESGTLETPNNALLISSRGELGLWDHIQNHGPALSRASTFSYREGDDGSRPKREGYFAEKTPVRDKVSLIRDSHTAELPHSGQTSSDGDISPTFSTTVSTVTYTPTASSGSETTTKVPRSLRMSTSNLDIQSSRCQFHELPGEHNTVSNPTSKKRVDLHTEPHLAECSDSSTHVQTPDCPSRSRPPLVHLRSSSLGNMSTNTNSIYSMGEINTAFNAVVAPATTIHVSSPLKDRLPNELSPTASRGVAEMLSGFENSSKAVRRAFDNERERGEWPSNLSSSISGIDEQHSPRRFHTARPAPFPPRFANARPPLSPILRSATSAVSPKKLVSFTSTMTNDVDETPSTSSARPMMPGRSGSLSRLWRRLSSSGSISKLRKDLDEDIPPVPQTKKSEWFGAVVQSPKDEQFATPYEKKMASRMRRSKGSLDLTSVNKENSTSLTSILKQGTSSSEGSHGVSVSSGSRRPKGNGRIVGVPPPRAQSVPLPIRSDTPPVLPLLEPSPPLTNPLSPAETSPRESSTSPLRDDNLTSADAGPSFIPIRSFKKVSKSSDRDWKTPLGPYTPPLSAIVNEYFQDLESSTSSDTPNSVFDREVTIHRASLHENVELQSYDAKRRYRQSLVEIKDDEAFHATVEQLVKLESDGRVRMTRAGGAALRHSEFPPIFRTPSKDSMEKHVRQENIRAWFVTRELVQGERRHGRLLAMGVAAVQSSSHSRKTIPPVPPLPKNDDHRDTPLVASASLTAHSRSGSGSNKNPSSRLRRPRNSTHGTPSTSSPTPTTHPDSLLQKSPLQILVHQLPKLHALSLSLSEAFEHDPSPYGVADAFVSMEESMTKAISEWAGQVGEVVFSGIGEELNKILDEQRLSRRGRRRRSGDGSSPSFGSTDDTDSDEGRLGFADIIIMPIQRASRYKLLFQELSTKLPPNSHTALKIHRALEAAIRLAAECDKCQSFDLNALRRQGKKGKRIRPVSVGPGMSGW